MNEDNTFMSFMRKVRTGDAVAAEELVRRYQSVIKSAVKRRLGSQPLRQRFDESDVCQSVLNSFFARYAAGQYDLDDPKQLAALLVAMAQNKFRQQARFQFRERRDVRVGVAEEDGRPMQLQGREADPERQAAAKELLQKLLSRLTDEERRLAELRSTGMSWDEIATEMGGNAQARRKQLSRAIERVSPGLGIDSLKKKSRSNE
jgi:RNA polymerase sigma factor (sigma-70 family)